MHNLNREKVTKKKQNKTSVNKIKMAKVNPLVENFAQSCHPASNMPNNRLS
jgi:hypothetical protein